jgi:hypothetical protein
MSKTREDLAAEIERQRNPYALIETIRLRPEQWDAVITLLRPAELAQARADVLITDAMIEAGNDAAYEAAAMGGGHKEAMRAALEAALALQQKDPAR